MATELYESIRSFLFTGQAHFTLTNVTSNETYSYEVEKSTKREGMWFVRLQVDNEQWRYVGCIFEAHKDKLTRTRGSTISFTHPAVKLFSWYLYFLMHDNECIQKVELKPYGMYEYNPSNPEGVANG